ncbi:hypothetical protein CMQ_3972 [Grosmannia clavigera kw1407]|uniref:Autophagy-related protein 28 n=1 Tax=Grosmannia clavigera (strain kw1407 / UAMH 11150) TaxID=655863 RepID=F0X9Y5_GROCL|nr:uncharacterized protein CMQ_3972 [Grosmannia clavigera kw1407]EFX05903.1 hypothetical protein CMQ_3972 [Grosmannia clavigera kw1407]
MASRPSLFSRFSYSGEKLPVPPRHSQISRRPIQHKPSEYDLDQLSPNPRKHIFNSGSEPAFSAESASVASHSIAMRRQQSSSPRASPSWKEEPSWAPPSPVTRPKQRALFAGPPPPIASSVLLHREIEDRGGSIQLSPGYQPGDHMGTFSDRLSTSTVIFDQTTATADRRGPRTIPYENESKWVSLQRRQRSIQRDIQKLLDVQSAGLLAGLGRGPLSPGSGTELGSDTSGSLNRSRSRGNTPTADSVRTTSTPSLRLPTDRATASGAVIPVRQPRPKKLGLRGARSGLARSISQLAVLKAEEDATLMAALKTRKRALTQLRKLANRRDNIVGELHSLEADDGEPLTRELITLSSAHTETTKQILELERQLAMLRSRKRTLEGRIADATSQRDAGLSGYRGALKEVEGQLSAVLSRPSVQPLDVEALGNNAPERPPGTKEEDDPSPGGDESASPTGGVEFLRLRPERRTMEMARSWWEGEVEILERRKLEVRAERTALEKGAAVWEDVVHLVSGFESNLRRQMSGEDSDDVNGGTMGKGKAPALNPEEHMQAQLGKMAEIMTKLGGHMRTAENKGWNLLICAIGAELEAFQEARQMLREALRAAGIHVDDEEPKSGSAGNSGIDEEDSSSTPRLTQSVVAKTTSRPAEVLVDTEDNDSHGHGTSESDDNDVPADLFATHNADDDERSTGGNDRNDHLHDRDDSSENEVPLEFLSGH